MSYRVLLCDDEIHILRAAEFKLSRAGYDVQCATNGMEAWEEIQRSERSLQRVFTLPPQACRRVQLQ